MKPTVPGSAARDHRIDWLRGLALAMIFVNHMPGNWLESWTSRNFGFSDAAEVFVLLAGVAASFAFFRRFEIQGAKSTVFAVARRARTLYLAHLASTLAAVSVFALAAWVYGNPDYLDLIGVSPLFTDPMPGIIGILVGTHQLGYFNILPMYVVLLALAPALIWLAQRDLRLMLAASATLYVAAQHPALGMPSYPTDGGWFFHPFAWQLLFAIGLALGILRQRGMSVPWHPVAGAIAAGYVAFSAIWMVASLGGVVGAGVVPDVMGTLAKSRLPATRLLHLLALAYLLVHSPLWDRLARLSADHPLTRMGRNSLPVFCAGSVLSMIGYVILVASGGGVVIETVLVAGGLMLLAGLAVALEDGIGALVPVAAAGQARSLVLHTAGWVRTLRAGR